MKVIIAGSRGITNPTHLDIAVLMAKDMGIKPTEIVSGGAVGVDKMGEHIATLNNIPIKQFLPDRKRHGKAAGPIRNKQMVDYADALIAVWDGKSKGTLSTIQYAQEKGIQICVYTVPGGSK